MTWRWPIHLIPIKQWDRAAFATDPWGRNLYGTPPQSIADYAFWQHILCSITPKTGRCAILFPHGVLFRDAEEEMRRKVIEADLIECIVGLGPNLFYNSSMPSCVVICCNSKPKAGKGKILLINAVNDVTRERAQSFLADHHIRRIIEAYGKFKNEPGFARVVTMEEVRANSHNLNLSLYVMPTIVSPTARAANGESVTDAINTWLKSRTAMAAALEFLGKETLSQESLKLQASNTFPLLKNRKDWRKVRLGDLVEKTEETERNPLAAGFDRYLMVEHMDAGSLRIHRWGDIADGTLPPTFYKVFRKGQILYPTRNPHLRRATVAHFDGICGEKTLTLSVREGVEPRFLPFIFQSEAFIEFSTNRKIGSTNPHVRWRDVAEFEFDLPPLDQQRRIAEILWAVDEMSDAVSTYAKDAATLRMSHLRSAFTKQDKYELRRVRETGLVQLGRQRAPKYQTGTSTKPYLRVANVFDGFLDYSDVLQMDFDERDFETYQLHEGDILLNEGQSRELVGRCAIYDGKLNGCCFQNTLIRYRAGDGVLTEYAFAFFQYCFHSGAFAAIASQTTSIAHLGADRFGTLLMPVPPIAEQKRIAEELKRIHSLESSIADHFNNSQRLCEDLINAILI